MNHYDKWIALKAQQEQIAKELLDTEVAIYNEFAETFNTKSKGTFHVLPPGYKVTVVKRENVKVDQAMAEAIGFGFRKKYELDAKEYKDLSEEKKKLVDQALTTTPGKPTFTVERDQ